MSSSILLCVYLPFLSYTLGVQCQDRDECATGGHDCHSNATCQNQPGAYTCSCLPGYAGNGTDCDDVDECLISGNGGGSSSNADGDACQENAMCVNYEGGFTCVCAQGFAESVRSGTAAECLDLDECALGGHDCHGNALCNNTAGGFDCSCGRGYVGECTDVEDTQASAGAPPYHMCVRCFVNKWLLAQAPYNQVFTMLLAYPVCKCCSY